MIDRAQFFARIRVKPFAGWMAQSQVDGISAVLDEWERRTLIDLRWLAYILASVFHETGQKMQPIAEGGGDAYLRSKSYYPWYGRGLIQITWAANYKKFGISNADDALSWPVALRVLFDGMIEGLFTDGKHKLADHFSGSKSDPLGARRIVNGTDKAAPIAGYHDAFYAALLAAEVPDLSAPLRTPTDKPPIKRVEPDPPETWWQRLTRWLGRS
jgi:putative chitinase